MFVLVTDKDYLLYLSQDTEDLLSIIHILSHITLKGKQFYNIKYHMAIIIISLPAILNTLSLNSEP